MKKDNNKVKKQRTSSSSKPLVILVAVLLLVAGFLGYIWRVLTTADYFKIKSIVSREALSDDLSYLLGRNIFKLDLPKESLNILKTCPDCYRIRLARVLPDRLYVEYVKRRPMAFIKFSNYVAVDNERVLFKSSINPEETGLPIILGLESKLNAPRSGMRCDIKELAVALDILAASARNPMLRDYRISKIDVADIDDITILIPLVKKVPVAENEKGPQKPEYLEVKISQGDIRDKVAIMAGLINQEKQNLASIKYIDLRFREPVIKFKDVK
jgi:cell division septal protein FtsQ